MAMTRDFLPLGLPDKIHVQHQGPVLEITRRWFGGKHVLMAVFTVGWNAFLFFWYSQALQGDDLVVILFPLIHVAVGVSLIYQTLSGFLNRTSIRVTYEQLRIRHYPIPHWRNRTILSRDLIQLYSKEKTKRSSKNTSVTYEMHALTRDGKNVKLLSGLDSSEQALYIEQEIERYLGIRDEPVRGEISR